MIQSKSETNIKRYDEIYQSVVEIYKQQQIKKRILLSPNKIISHQKILQVFQPYRKEIQKLRIKNNRLEIGDTPFSLALKQLGIFYQFQSKNKNKMIPSKQVNNAYRSVPKKGKQKLKPISEGHIKINSKGKQFLSIQKINLIDNDLKNKPFSIYNGQINFKKQDDPLYQQRQQIQKNVKKIQDLKNIKDLKMHPQLYIRKTYNSNLVQTIKFQDQKQKQKKVQKPVHSLLKYYPSLKNNLKIKPVTSNGNFSIISYKKQSQSPTKNISLSQTHSFRILQTSQQLGNYIVGQEDQLAEGFYNSNTIADPIIKQENLQDDLNQNNKQTISLESPGYKLQKRKKFFSQLPFQTYFYRDLIWKMNFSNDIFVQTPLQYQHRLKAYIGKGNNSSMIQGLIKRRIWFAITDKVEEANFVWTQLKQLNYYKKQQPGKQIVGIVNCQNKTNGQYIGGILNSKDHFQFKKYFETFINFEQRSDERLQNRQKGFSYQQVIKINQIRDQKVQNHLINNYVIGNKKALFHTMSNYYSSIGEDVFNFLPLTFHIENGLQDQSWYKFLKYYYKRNKEIKAQNEQNSTNNGAKQHNAWIVKPGENSNRGNGIQVCLSLQEIKNIIKKREKYNDGSNKTYIVQIYIEKPLLYQKRKFDIRHYMMMTCVNGKVKGYFYKDGYVRTTSTEYNLKTNCGKIHLTNDAIQKNLPDYGKYEKGNKISYDELHNYMSKQSKHKKFDFWNQIYPRMKKITTDVVKACSGGIDPDKLINNFQVFGMDFMIDSDYNVWLIEVNSNPCLELSCPLLGSIIPRMVENSLELTLDCLFPPPVRYTPKGVHYYKNLQQQNRFELVYDQKVEGLYTSSMDVLDGKMLYEEDDTFEDDGDQWKDD